MSPLPTPRPLRESLMCFLLDAYAPIRDRGMLLEGPAHLPARRTASSRTDASPAPATQRISPENVPLGLFVARLRELLETEDEPTRQTLEKDVLRLARPLQAAGVFDVLRIAHPAAAHMVADHLAGQPAGPQHAAGPASPGPASSMAWNDHGPEAGSGSALRAGPRRHAYVAAPDSTSSTPSPTTLNT